LRGNIVIGYIEVGIDRALCVVFDWEYHFDFHGQFQGIAPRDDGGPNAIKTFVPALLTG
jgi:hypothetical protein